MIDMRERQRMLRSVKAVGDAVMLFPPLFFLRLAFRRHGNTIQDILLNDRYKKNKNKREAVDIYIFDESPFAMWTSRRMLDPRRVSVF